MSLRKFAQSLVLAFAFWPGFPVSQGQCSLLLWWAVNSRHHDATTSTASTCLLTAIFRTKFKLKLFQKSTHDLTKIISSPGVCSKWKIIINIYNLTLTQRTVVNTKFLSVKVKSFSIYVMFYKKKRFLYGNTEPHLWRQKSTQTKTS